MSVLTHSPPFRVLISDVIAPGQSVLVRSSESTTSADSKYSPFNRLFVQNLDSQPLDVEYGLGRIMRIPGGMSMNIDQPGITQIRITNVGTGNTSEPIEVTYQLKPTVEDITYAQYTGMPLYEAMRR